MKVLAIYYEGLMANKRNISSIERVMAPCPLLPVTEPEKVKITYGFGQCEQYISSKIFIL
jgi:hypothetical protein